jgi:hypothetical protein
MTTSTSTPESSKTLPLDWVKRLWSELRATYGAAFDRQWECPTGVDPEEHVNGLMRHWALSLGGYVDKPEALRHGLDHLPPHPPNLIEFRALCMRCPEKALPQLPSPKADPARVAQLVASITVSPQSPKAWAQRLREKEAQGASLTAAQRDMWRAALRTAAVFDESVV